MGSSAPISARDSWADPHVEQCLGGSSLKFLYPGKTREEAEAYKPSTQCEEEWINEMASRHVCSKCGERDLCYVTPRMPNISEIDAATLEIARNIKDEWDTLTDEKLVMMSRESRQQLKADRLQYASIIHADIASGHPDIVASPLAWVDETIQLVHCGDNNIGVLLALLWGAGANLGRNLPDAERYKSQVILLGASGTGKTDLQKKAMEFVRPENRVFTSGATGAALRRFFSNVTDDIRLFVNDELGGFSQEDETAAVFLKMIGNENDAGDYLVNTKGEDGNWEVTKMKVPPNMSFGTSYAKPWIPNENASRMWTPEVDNTPEHTKRVIDAFALGDNADLDVTNTKFKKRMELWQAEKIPMMESFRGKITIPFLEPMRDLFPEGSPMTIRNVKRFKQLIEIITAFHAALDPTARASIERNEKTYWIAEPQDFALACEIGKQLLQNANEDKTETDDAILDALYDYQRSPLEKARLNTNHPDEGFKPGYKPAFIAKLAKRDVEYVRKRLYKLVESGKVDVTKTSPKGVNLEYRALGNTEFNDPIATWEEILPRVEDATTAFFATNKITKLLAPQYKCLSPK